MGNEDHENSRNNEDFVCEICAEKVLNGEKTIRVIVDTRDSDGHGGGVPADNDFEIVLNLFHRECVFETRSSRECDSIPYIDEAREMVDEIFTDDYYAFQGSVEHGKN